MAVRARATARWPSPREHAKGDVAARGTASDLLLFLWGRVPATALEVFGDAELLDRFQDGDQGLDGDRRERAAGWCARASPRPRIAGAVVVTPFAA